MPVKGSIVKPVATKQANMESFIDMISGTTVPVKPKKVLPAQAGKKWTDDETGKLLISIQKKLSIGEIATKHQRTHGAISAMLRQLAVRYIADGYDMALAQRFTGLSETVIRDAIAKSEMRAAARK
jgi:hypothetical protein